MNVKLLRKIAKVIQERPKEFDMESFTGYRECRTTHCIGGWAEAMTNKPMHEALGITNEEEDRLFYAENWPAGFGGYNATPKQAAARIEHFIKTKGAE